MNGNDLHPSIPDPVNDKERRSNDDQFPRARQDPLPAEPRMAGQAADRFPDLLGHMSGRTRFVLGDVLTDFRQLMDGVAGPNYPHLGAGRSRPLPQLASQASTAS